MFFPLIPWTQLVSLTVIPSESKWFLFVCCFFLFFFSLHFALGLSCTLLCLHHLVCFTKRCFVRFVLSFASPSPASLWFFHRKPFVLNKQTLICMSSSALQQGCQVTSPAPALEQLWSGPEQRAETVCAAILSDGPWVQHAWEGSHSTNVCLVTGSPRNSSCWLLITCIMTWRVQMLPGVRETLWAPQRRPCLPSQVLISQHAGSKPGKSQKVRVQGRPSHPWRLILRGGERAGGCPLTNALKSAHGAQRRRRASASESQGGIY